LTQRLLQLLMQHQYNQLPIGKVLLTSVGEELATVCKASGIDGFEDYVKEKWAKYIPHENNTEQSSEDDA